MRHLLTSFSRRLGVVRIRQLLDQLRHLLSFVPGLYVLGAIVAVQITLFVDRRLSSEDVPLALTTTVESARSVFTVIAGGLITAITLLLSMTLVTVQLASSQFSPRTLRDWLADRLLQHTVGLALGVTVFTLMGLRSTRTFGDDGQAVVPHTTVLVALLAAVFALFMLVRSVDHTTHSLRIGAVAERISAATVRAIDLGGDDHDGDRGRRAAEGADTADTDPGQHPGLPPANAAARFRRIAPAHATTITAPDAGWVQQIDVSTLVDALPDGAEAWVLVPVGSFVLHDQPVLRVALAGDQDVRATQDQLDDDVRAALLDAFAFGDTRTLQQDFGFGITQLTDIAVRALSPGINDPTTASDVIVHLADVLLHLWERRLAGQTDERDGKRVVTVSASHAAHLRRAYDPVRRAAIGDPAVLTTLARTLRTLRDEAVRRDLPGPVEPIDELLHDVDTTADRTGWSSYERAELRRAIDGSLPPGRQGSDRWASSVGDGVTATGAASTAAGSTVDDEPLPAGR